MYSLDRFCSFNCAKVRKVGISEIWIRGMLTSFVDSEVAGKSLTARKSKRGFNNFVTVQLDMVIK